MAVLRPGGHFNAAPETAEETRSLEPLEGLLKFLFNNNELRRFVEHGPKGNAIKGDLPSGALSPNALSKAVVDAYRQEGMIDVALFDRLTKKRSGMTSRIRKVQRAILGSPWTRKRMMGVLDDLTPGDWAQLKSIYLDQPARIVTQVDGRTQQQLALIEHYSGSRRTLSQLAQTLREAGHYI